MHNKVTKLISRSFSCYTMSERLKKDLGMKRSDRTAAHNQLSAIYLGTYDGVNFEIELTRTRHMGDFTELHVSADNFASMAALVRFYRDLKYKTTHQRYNEK